MISAPDFENLPNYLLTKTLTSILRFDSITPWHFRRPNLEAAVTTHCSAPAGVRHTKKRGSSRHFNFSFTPSGPGEIWSAQLIGVLGGVAMGGTCQESS
jgi:hypothetical protein